MAGLLRLTAHDIAEREHIPIGTAKTPIRRAFERLRAHVVTDPTEHVATTKTRRMPLLRPGAKRRSGVYQPGGLHGVCSATAEANAAGRRLLRCTNQLMTFF
jgi:hypothetical protein